MEIPYKINCFYAVQRWYF